MAYRIGPTGAADSNTFYLYGYSLPINSAKSVKSIALPSNRNVAVLAMSLIPAAAAGTAATSIASAIAGSTTSASGASTGSGGSASGSTSTGSSGGSSTSSGSSGTTSSVDVTQEIVVSAGSVIAPITANQIGSNLGGWYNVAGKVNEALKASGAHLVRWPGGSLSDGFHWQSQALCPQMGGAMDSNGTFDDIESQVIQANGVELALTVNYGSNSACTGGGDPAEAAAWVAHAKSQGYSNVHHWTVGNEVFGGWEFDLHAKAHDAATYAAAVGGSNGYYQQMKAADSTAQVGVVVSPGFGNWDGIVLANAKYDFVELHWYAQETGRESDSYLLNQAPAELTSELAALRAELAAVGKANTPILIGEFNSVNESPGKQTMSIVNALFIGMTYGELLNDNVSMATSWFGYGGTCNNGNNNSSSLYGFQSFGGYDQVSAGAPWWGNCGLSSLTIPAGTVLPNGYAQQLVSQFAPPGGSVLSTSVGSKLSNVRAYASSNSSGYSVMMFNLSQTATTAVAVNVANAKASSYNASTVTYGKAQYDDSKNNVWTAPVSQNLGTANGTATVTLPPWSMTVLKLN